MKDRLGIGTNTPPEKEPRVSTIHSLALSGIRKNPKAFGLGDRVTPLDEYDQAQLMKKVVERYDAKCGTTVERERGFQYAVLEKIGFHRARGVGFRKEYTSDVHELALEQHAGYHAMTPEYLDLWELFEDEKRTTSTLDFDDMIWLFNRRARADEIWRKKVQSQFDHVLVDEAQDLSKCHPPGTLVRKYIGQYGGQRRPALTEEVPIEQLKDGDRVIAWRRRWAKCAAKGLPVKIGKRQYDGDLVEITCGDKVLQMTPDHRVYAMMNGDGEEKYVVYLMWGAHGFRIGQCAVRYCRDTKHKPMGGLGTRFVEERAEKGWILKVIGSKTGALAWEQILSCRYGIPTAQFPIDNGTRNFEFTKLIFSEVTGDGKRCLCDHGLLFEHPLYVRETDGKRKRPSKRYFETHAVNLIPDLMSLPSPEPFSQLKIDAVKRVPYSGLVYSLDVETWHTYVANGIVVKNCQWEFVNHLLGQDNGNLYAVGDISQSIYAFNGASPELMIQYSENWRGVTPTMYRIARNHRSLREIVKLANKIQTTMTETIPLQMEVFREEDGEWKLAVDDLPQTIASGIAAQIQNDARRKRDPILYKENAILVRSGMQIRDIEGELVRRRIPYIVRGGKALLQTEEVRDIMGYLRLASNHKDFVAFMRCCSVPRCGVGEVALTKLRVEANQENDGDLIEASKKNERLHNLIGIIEQIEMFKETPVVALEKLLALFNYRAYLAEKYKKDKDKVKTKLENIDRFFMMVVALTDGTDLTLDDLIFQMALDRSKGDETEKALYDRQLASGELTPEQHAVKMDELKNGSVTISTIHCSPPDEPVLTTEGNKPIACLDPDSDRLYSYIPKCNQLVRGLRHERKGYKFSVRTRPYSGDLVVIDTAESHTRVTPEHRVRVAFHETFYNKWVVYLMRRGDWWRIGVCSSARRPYRSGGVKGRLATEKADCAWVIGVYDTREAALTAEIKYQVTYGIPSICFEKWHHKTTSEQLQGVHEELRPIVFPRAIQLLADKKLLIDEPLYRRESRRWVMLDGNWFDTVAANMLDGYMVVPVAIQSDFDRKAPISPRPLQAKVTREHYEGLVFSLDVPPHEYYVSGGIVVHNSAKGLEWRKVFVFGLVEGFLPHRFSLGSDSEIEEERRLFYVACTRARDMLILCVHEKEQRGPNTARVAPSRFLREIGVGGKVRV